jgi:hypothetical protein
MFLLVAGVGAAAPAVASGQDASSQKLAARLAERLGSAEASAIAAPDPGDTSRFVAALHIPGVQLLVIGANYQSPALLRELIAKGDYRQVYLDLNAAGDREGRFFVEDLGADRLRPERERNEPFDITWRDASQRTMYNGEWREQKLEEEDYRARFEKDEGDYAELLQILLAAEDAG